MNTKTNADLRNLTSVYLMKNDQILLLYRQGSRVVNNVWVSSAGGHFEQDELNNARKCALRELKEELGVDESMLSDFCLRYVTLYHNAKDLRQNYYFFAHLKEDAPTDFSSNEGTVSWFQMDELSELTMPFTSRKVIDHYLSVGRYTDQFYAGISSDEKMFFHELTEFV